MKNNQNPHTEPGGNVMFFDREKLVIAVVPKAACSSIKRTLANRYDSETHREQVEQVKAKLGGKHDRWRYALRALRLLTDERMSDDYLRIAVVRNPWDRARSMYADKCLQRRRPNERLRGLGFRKNMGWRVFIKLIHAIPDAEAEKHFRSQYLTTHLIGPPDILVRFEDLAAGWQLIQRLFMARGNQELPELPVMNDTRRIKKPDWTPSLVEMIAERYKKDIELLGYERATPLSGPVTKKELKRQGIEVN